MTNSNNEYILKTIELMDREIQSLSWAVHHADRTDDSYDDLVRRLNQMVEAKQKFVTTVAPELLDNRSAVQKVLDKIDMTQVIKVVAVSGLVVFVLKHEEFEVISGKAAEIVCRMLTLKL